MSIVPQSDPTDDPWDWSVDQVIKEFCRHNEDRPVWCSPTDNLPNPATLKSALRDNDVTGEVLLLADTKEILLVDLNIKSRGQRYAMEKGISYLRLRSHKFQAPPTTPLQSWLHASGPPYEYPSNIGDSVRSGVPLRQTPESARLDVQVDAVGRSNLPCQNATGPAIPLGACASSKETPLVEQAPNPSPASAPPIITENITAASPQQVTAVKARRRIPPTFVAHLDDKAHHSLPSFGEKDRVASHVEAVGEDVDERQFNFGGIHIPDGQRISSFRSLKKYLTQPQKGSLIHTQIFSGFRAANDATECQSASLQKGPLESNDHGEFGYLLAKYPAMPESEDLLALYGDSGEEGNFDEETWYEIERDAAEDQTSDHSSRALPLLVVESTIDEVIQEFRSSWQETKLAKVQAKGFRLWKRANREGLVENELANAQFWVQRFQQSVTKIRQAIARETWQSTGAVRHQCQSLQESIFQQQEYQYYVSVLRRTVAPPRPDRRSIKRKFPKPLDLAEGEIILESESELSMSNFIDEDTTGLATTAPSPTATQKLDPVHATDDSDHLISGRARRHQAKAGIASVARSESRSSTKPVSLAADTDIDRPAPLASSRYGNTGHAKDAPIELNSSSDPSSPANIGPPDVIGIQPNDDDDRQQSTPTRLKIKGPKSVSELDDIEAIMQMPWSTIELTQDRRRALAKAVYSLPPEKVREIWQFLDVEITAFVKIPGKEDLRGFLKRAFSAILNRQAHVEGISEDHWDTARLITLLFTSYCLAKSVLDEHRLDKEGTLRKAECLVDSGRFCFLRDLEYILLKHPEGRLLKEGKRKLSNAQSQNEEGNTTDSESFVPQQTPGKKKRRRVKQSQVATSQQLAGQMRVQEAEQRLASLGSKFQNIPRNLMDPANYAIGMKEPIIYLDSRIGSKVKEHQVNGIRFMWREIMTDENKQGCLLAHTMGLGKTMQVISLLVTIAQSASSPDAGVREQVPHDLREMKALILCPPSLIDNWYEEILMWRPEPTVLGGLYKITQKLRRPDRVQEIAQWVLTGGILIISYDMFRGLIVNKTQAGRGADGTPLNEADHGIVQRHLLDHPNIIIGDEAHKMKNTQAGISMVTSRFRSTRRIALTGSPLANNLDEYFAMIDWIAPGYLGTKEQFRSKYAIPIADGLWNDSDLFDRRTSLRKLHVLKKNLDPKISRADITAIADDLPPKTEFFITVPLTKIQIKAYNLYVTTLLGGAETRTTGIARMWDWLAILSLLCNHPSTFLNKLDDRQYGHESKIKKGKAKTVTTTDDVEGAGLPTDVELADAGLSPQLVEQQRKIFRAVEDSGQLEDPSLSRRSQIVCDIIELSVAAGDKVLLFSHSIPTLNYLEATVSSLGHSTCRLDGSTNVTKRQEAVKDFNKETATYNVFFISTRAGGLGLNLQGANRVILFDYGFNPIWEEQAIGRAYRLGQLKPVFVYRLRAGGTFEEVIYNKAVFKTQLSARVVDKKNPMRYASKKATDYLFPVKEVPQEELTPYYGKDPLVLDQVLRKSNCIRDITLTETFQREEDESLTPEEVKQANDELKDEQEQRRDPVGYQHRRARHQAALSNTRLQLSDPASGRRKPPGHNFPPRPSNTGHRQSRESFVPPITGDQQRGYISRPEAIGGPQQAESGIWDHRATPHLQNQVANVLGARPFSNSTIETGYPSPTTVAQPDQVRKAPGSPSQLGKQLDGALDGDLAGCTTQ